MSYLDTPIFFLCNDPERALGLETFLDNYHIICIDNNSIIDNIIENGGKVFCLERKLNKRNPIFRNSNKLLQEEFVQKYIKDSNDNVSSPKVIFFKIASNIEHTCKELNYWYLNTSAKLNKKFETKISQYNLLKNEAVNFPKTVVGELGSFSYSDLIQELGDNFVIQYARGHTGSSTNFIGNEEEFDLEKNKFPKRMARISRFIRGDAWTINACATRFGILYGGLSYQITGVSDLTTREGGTVGNDWSYGKNLESFTVEQIKKITVRVGRVMKRYGFRGLFGLDLIVDENGEVFLIEINARQPASTSMHTKLMLQQGLIPLQIFHIAEFLYKDDSRYYSFINNVYKKISRNYDEDESFVADLSNENQLFSFRNRQNDKAIKPINASQIFLRNTDSESVKIKKLVSPGVYDISNHSRIKKGYSIQDLDSSFEYLLLAQNEGLDVNSGNELARIQMLDGALDSEGNLKSWVLETLVNVKKNLLE